MVVEKSEHPVWLVVSEGGDGDEESPTSWKAFPSKNMLYVYPQLHVQGVVDSVGGWGSDWLTNNSYITCGISSRATTPGISLSLRSSFSNLLYLVTWRCHKIS